MKLAYLKCTVWRVLTAVCVCVAISQSRYQLSPVRCYHTALSRYFSQQRRTLSFLFICFHLYKGNSQEQVSSIWFVYCYVPHGQDILLVCTQQMNGLCHLYKHVTPGF